MSINDLTNGKVIASVTADGVKTVGSLLNELYGLITVPKTHKLHLIIVRVSGNNDIYNIYTLKNSGITFSRTGLNFNETSNYLGVAKLQAADSKYFSFVNGEKIDYSDSVETSGTVLKISY